jgi:hypothetical protein
MRWRPSLKRLGDVNPGIFMVGAICALAAIAGGGLEAQGVNVPAIESLGRQVLVFVLGSGLMVASATILAKRPEEGKPSAQPVASTQPLYRRVEREFPDGRRETEFVYYNTQFYMASIRSDSATRVEASELSND